MNAVNSSMFNGSSAAIIYSPNPVVLTLLDKMGSLVHEKGKGKEGRLNGKENEGEERMEKKMAGKEM